jgi:hypothetical protein
VAVIGAGGFWLGRRGGAWHPDEAERAAPAPSAEGLGAAPARPSASVAAPARPSASVAAPARPSASGPGGRAEAAAGPGAEGPGGEAPPATAAASVRVLVRATPPAEVYWGERRVGHTSAPVVLPRGERAVRLTLRAEGHRPFELEVTPDADRELTAVLRRAPAGRGRARVSSDLENPFD